VNSLERGLEVLLAVNGEHGCSVDEVARQVGLPLSTTYRYVKLLRDLGYLEEHESGVRCGPRMLQMVLRTDPNRALAEMADPVMAELVETTGVSALLGVRFGLTALCIHSVDPRPPVRLSYQLFTPQPLYAGASGKPLLAYAPTAVVERIISEGMPRYTSSTPDAAHLRHQLALIRSAGYCLTVGELDEQVAAVGVPVFMGRTVVAALSVAGPLSHFDSARLAAVRDRVVSAGRRLGALLEQSPIPPDPTPLRLAPAARYRHPVARPRPAPAH
jgi:DNA-binding IclR family transcriptional regulator